MRSDGLHQIRTEAGAGDGRPKNDSIARSGHIQEPLFPISLAAGLEKGGEDIGLIRQLLEFLDIVVIKHDVEAQHLFQHATWDTRHAAIIHCKDGDRLPGVDGASQPRLGQPVVEGAEVRVLAEDLGYVEGV